MSNVKIMTHMYQCTKFIDKEDITLVTHGLIDQIPFLYQQLQKWGKGPIIFTIYLNSIHHIHNFILCYQHR